MYILAVIITDHVLNIYLLQLFYAILYMYLRNHILFLVTNDLELIAIYLWLPYKMFY